MIKKLLFIAPFYLTSQLTQAQMVAGSAYMQGSYVEIGIDSLNGYEGANTYVAAPFTGLHFRSNTQYFGFVANPQMDGWVNYDGDFYTPGTPENGWGIEFIDTTTTDTFNIKLQNNRNELLPSIPGYITGYSNVGGVITVNWHGDYVSGTYDLDFDLSYVLNASSLFYTTSMTIFNNGPANIEELYYYRNMDPDNNIMLSGSYVTSNMILSQPTATTGAAVKAQQTSPWLSTVAFYSADTSARVASGGFSNRDASDLWNGYLFHNTPGDSTVADEAIAIAFHQPGLVSFTRAGTSSVTFTYQTAFSQGALDALIDGTAMTVAEQTIDGLNVYPNPANNVLNIYANEKINSVTILNTVGTIVYSNNTMNMNGNQLDISSLKPGIYFVTISSGTGIVTKKIVKK